MDTRQIRVEGQLIASRVFENTPLREDSSVKSRGSGPN